MSKLVFNINNGRTLTLDQAKRDGSVRVTTGRDGIADNAYNITPGDMVMLINYYCQQRDKGEPVL